MNTGHEAGEGRGDALARFAALLDAYGAEPKRWPAAGREDAQALLARSAEARRLHADAARLDLFLDSAVPAPVPAHLVRRVLATSPAGTAAVPALAPATTAAVPDTAFAEPARPVIRPVAASTPDRAARRPWFAGLFRPALGLAFAAVIGIALGNIVSPFENEALAALGADTESVVLDQGNIAESEL